MPIPVAERCRECVCGPSLVGVAGSNPTGCINILWLLSVVRNRSLRRADHSFRGVLRGVMCQSVIVRPWKWGGPGPMGAVVPCCEICKYHKGKLKQSHYRPWQVLSFSGVWGSQISRQSAHKSGRFVSPAHLPTLTPGNIFDTRFC